MGAVIAIHGRFGHERRAVAVFFRDTFGHELEETVFVRSFERVAKVPVHFR